MTSEMFKGKKILFLIAAFITAMEVSGEQGVMPFVYNLYETFPNNSFAVSYICSAGALFMVLGSLGSTALLKKLSKKVVLVLATATFTVATLACMVYPTIPVLVVARSFMGLGEGVVSVSIMALFAEVYLDEVKRATIIGYYNATLTLFGAAMSSCSGILVTRGWQKGFYVYLPAILMVIMVILFIPNIKVGNKQRVEANERIESETLVSYADKKEPLGKKFWICVFDYVVFTLGFAAVSYFVSTYVAENRMGSSALSGNWLALVNIAGLITCVAFGKIYGKLKAKVTIPCIVLTIVSLGVMGFAPSVTGLLICGTLLGAAYGTYYSFSFAYVSEIVPVTRINDGIGLITAMYSTAYFCITFIVTGLMSLTGGLITPIFLIFAIVTMIPLVIEIIVCFFRN